MPNRSDSICYRSIAGDVYGGVLTGGPRPDGTVSVDLFPGTVRPFSLLCVRWSETPSAETYTCWPKP